MTPKTLRMLICPSCRKNLIVKRSYYKKKGRIIHALLSCECSKYPLVGGVLFLIDNKITEKALLFLEQGKLSRSEEVPIFLFRLPLGNYLTVKVVQLFTLINIFKFLSFEQFMKLFIFLGIYEKKWGNYLLNRFETDSFHSLLIASSLVKPGSSVADLGSGAGHFLRVLAKKTDQNNITAVETSLPGIYLAKKYFCPGANYIYSDLESPLPFKTGIFDCTFINDALQYISDKKSLGVETSRVVKKRGFISLNGLYNKYFARSFADPSIPENPSGYASNFPGYKYSLFSNKNSKEGILKYIKNPKTKEKSKELKTFSLMLAETPVRKDIKVDMEL